MRPFPMSNEFPSNRHTGVEFPKRDLRDDPDAPKQLREAAARERDQAARVRKHPPSR